MLIGDILRYLVADGFTHTVTQQQGEVMVAALCGGMVTVAVTVVVVWAGIETAYAWS